MFVFFPHDGHLPFLFVNIYTNINALSCKNFITLIAHKLKFCLEIIYLIYEFQLMLFQTYHLDVAPAMPASPPEKGIFRFLIDRTWVRSIPSRLTGRDGIIFVIFDIDHFPFHI